MNIVQSILLDPSIFKAIWWLQERTEVCLLPLDPSLCLWGPRPVFQHNFNINLAMLLGCDFCDTSSYLTRFSHRLLCEDTLDQC